MKIDSKNNILENIVNIQDFYKSKVLPSKNDGLFNDKEDPFMIKDFGQYLRNLVRENAKKLKYEYYLDFDDLSFTEQEIIMHNLVDEDDFEAYHQYLDSPPVFFTKALILKYQSECQKLINETCNEVFFDDLRENGIRYHYDNENGELVINY